MALSSHMLARMIGVTVLANPSTDEVRRERCLINEQVSVGLLRNTAHGEQCAEALITEKIEDTAFQSAIDYAVIASATAFPHLRRPNASAGEPLWVGLSADSIVGDLLDLVRNVFNNCTPVQRADAQHHRPEPPFVSGQHSTRSLDILRRAKDVIKRDFCSPLTVEHIAKQAGTNRTDLSIIFRDQLDCSVIRHLTQVRMSVAASQLSLTTKPINSIAWDVGYRNNASFSRAFTAMFGSCPRLFRRDHRLSSNDACRRAEKERSIFRPPSTYTDKGPRLLQSAVAIG